MVCRCQSAVTVVEYADASRAMTRSATNVLYMKKLHITFCAHIMKWKAPGAGDLFGQLLCCITLTLNEKTRKSSFKRKSPCVQRHCVNQQTTMHRWRGTFHALPCDNIAMHCPATIYVYYVACLCRALVLVTRIFLSSSLRTTTGHYCRT